MNCLLFNDKFEYTSEDFSLFYLLNDSIEDMLTLFDNETENGKLFLSYPMSEVNSYDHEYFIGENRV